MERVGAGLLNESQVRFNELDKEELMELGKDEVEFKIFLETSTNIVPLPRKRDGKLMEIFMGSSSEATDFMMEIAAKLESLNTSPLMWNALGKNILCQGQIHWMH